MASALPTTEKAPDIEGPRRGAVRLERRGVHLEQVITLHRIGNDQLPIGRPLLRASLRPPMMKSVDAGCDDLVLDVSEAVSEGSWFGMHRGQHEAVPFIDATDVEAVCRRVEFGSERCGQQTSVVGVRPGVVRILEPA